MDEPAKKLKAEGGAEEAKAEDEEANSESPTKAPDASPTKLPGDAPTKLKKKTVDIYVNPMLCHSMLKDLKVIPKLTKRPKKTSNNLKLDKLGGEEKKYLVLTLQELLKLN